MKISLKTLKGETITSQVDPEASILTVKEKVYQQKKIGVEDQKIVFKGKATVNTDQLNALGVKENDFLVIMVLVKKPQNNKPKIEESSESQQKKQEKKTLEIPKVPPTLEKSEQNAAEEENKIKNLMSMGFDREKCVAALSAAFGNEERGVEYLLNGIPSDLAFNEGQAEDEEDVQNIFRALVNNPNFQSFRNLLRSDPASLESVLAQIASTSMPLYNLIASNPQTFQRIVLEDEDDDEDFDGQQEEGEQVIHLEQQDQAAIARLMGFGFMKIDAAQAYFACDKNEQMALNLLLDGQANGQLGLGNQQYEGEGNESDEDDNLFH